NTVTCPACGKEVRRGKSNWYCAGYKDGCTFTVWESVAGAKITEKDIAALSGRLADMVKYAKTNAQWRQQFMTWEDEMKLQVRERAEVLAQEMVEEAREEAYREAQAAFETAAAQKAVETARKLLDKSVAVEIISDATGLPLEQVEQLQQEAPAVKA
ncbi:MAG: hypothetical protein K2N31_10530, partial [Treponemataceae bacterium]|nr:hypothetical protein [Treponemataceae bacterium]